MTHFKTNMTLLDITHIQTDDLPNIDDQSDDFTSKTRTQNKDTSRPKNEPVKWAWVRRWAAWVMARCTTRNPQTVKQDAFFSCGEKKEKGGGGGTGSVFWKEQQCQVTVTWSREGGRKDRDGATSRSQSSFFGVRDMNVKGDLDLKGIEGDKVSIIGNTSFYMIMD